MRPLSHKINNLLKYREAFHHYVYVISIASLGACLPLSIFGISFSLIVLISNWVLEADFKSKFSQLVKCKSVWLVLSILLLYIIGLLYTEDINYGIKRIKVLLILMTVNLVLGTMKPLSKKELKFIFQVFLAAVFFASLISVGNYCGIFGHKIEDIREISMFIYNSYFSLMINFSIILTLYYFILFEFQNKSLSELIIYVFLCIWFTFFIFFLRSFLGITVFFIVIPVFLLVLISKIQFRFFRILFYSLTGIIIFSFVTLLIFSILRYYKVDKTELINLQPYTINGNLYHHNPYSRQIENGHYVWIYICEKELRQEWNKISLYHYDSLDNKGQQIKHTIIRYLASKGLKKDSAGIHQLTSEDIGLIEKGYANYIFRENYGIYQRIYQIIWEIDMYFKTGATYSHSVAQRIAFFKQAVKILKRNFIIGVGTGDIRDEMIKQSISDNIQFQKDWLGKPHNQLLSFSVSFGIIGFCWVMLALILPVFFNKKQKFLLLNMFLLLYFISMFSVDTFDYHVGIAFFAFFYCIFLYLWDKATETEVSGKS
jgi:hypothetical protein